MTESSTPSSSVCPTSAGVNGSLPWCSHAPAPRLRSKRSKSMRARTSPDTRCRVTSSWWTRSNARLRASRTTDGRVSRPRAISSAPSPETVAKRARSRFVGVTNRLAEETSPYLRQHADNPVDWLPWGDEAFSRARAGDKPIFLSVGYSSCHWCHVMAHESFEDAGTARLMNELFVNIKVDREERPDVDSVYMQAVQALTGRGGWPMSVWCTPDGRPFYAGTYFPNDDRQGMPSFRRVLAGVAEAWRERREEIEQQSSRVIEAIARTASLRASRDPLSGDVLHAAVGALKPMFDP